MTRAGFIMKGSWLAVLVALAALGVFDLVQELRTCEIQARYLSALGRESGFRLEPGDTSQVRYPHFGPYDQRLGYTALAAFQQRLRERGFAVAAQARFSPRLLELVEAGFNAPYPEKFQAGLKLLDRDGQPLFSALYPTRVYPSFDAIPPLVLKTLLYIENRELLSERYPHRNPTIEWDRFAHAATLLAAHKLGLPGHVPGGSTLATQLEKYRHSPEGRTDSALEKLRQIGSASLRAYLDGPNTLKTRRAIALGYLNSVPLAAAPGYGEVQGLGDGLWVWFGADFETVNRLLASLPEPPGAAISTAAARAYRQVLCLILAQRRPAHYLFDGRDDLEALADSHLRLLAEAGVIPPALATAALGVRSGLGTAPLPIAITPFRDRKTETVLRARLAGLLGVERLYDLDRLDLTASSSLDQTTQRAVSAALRKLRQPEQARAAGVLGFRLLSGDSDFDAIVYSLILYERGAQGNLLRVQADSFDEPLDVNEGIRLDLGSTAKLRTLVHYLELVAELHQQYAGQPPEALRRVALHPRDHLSRWVIDQLLARPHLDLPALLEAALDKRYSASPGEAFFTGGGLHTFANFNKDDNDRILSLRVALQNSVNLVFIRLMREIAYHHLYRPEGVARWLDEDDGRKRRQYLERFADREGRVYLRRFYLKYRDQSPREALDRLGRSVSRSLVKLATVYRSVRPRDDAEALGAWLRKHYGGPPVSREELERLYRKYSPDTFDLHDRGYIAKVHPLELWLLGYRMKHPDATLEELIAASAGERQEVYRWLFKTSRHYAQNKRIWTLLEHEAFTRIHAAWKRLGYPFASLTPSYASSIGASADRPAALAELMGILMNDGVRLPLVRFDRLHFAAGTPYETLLHLPPAQGQPVLRPEVAAAARKALLDVVERGTAVRVRGAYKRPDGTPLPIAGKTGTGDHRREIFGAPGHLIASEVVSRTATFAFMLGDRLFGALTAYVTGTAAARFKFTSALPVQVLKSLEPTLAPLVARAYSEPPAPGPISNRELVGMRQ